MDRIQSVFNAEKHQHHTRDIPVLHRVSHRSPLPLIISIIGIENTINRGANTTIATTISNTRTCRLCYALTWIYRHHHVS